MFMKKRLIIMGNVTHELCPIQLNITTVRDVYKKLVTNLLPYIINNISQSQSKRG